MYEAPEKNWWQGRVDTEDGAKGIRWHQTVRFDPPEKAGVTLLGLASDLGVQNNRGRPGAAEGPSALRTALAGLAWHHRDMPLTDAGNIRVSDDLPGAQAAYADRTQQLLDGDQLVIGLGGGHEIAWGSYQGCRRHLDAIDPEKTLGIVNIDAHFDLRTPAPDASSGTPFFQVARHCQDAGYPFHYACLGIARSANTRALFERAEDLGVDTLTDIDFTPGAAEQLLQRILDKVDYLYLSCCLDVFPASAAPGVSAPAALGIPPVDVMQMIARLGELCSSTGVPCLMADVAELSPPHDIDGRTARLAARLVDELVAAFSRAR